MINQEISKKKESISDRGNQSVQIVVPGARDLPDLEDPGVEVREVLAKKRLDGGSSRFNLRNLLIGSLVLLGIAGALYFSGVFHSPTKNIKSRRTRSRSRAVGNDGSSEAPETCGGSNLKKVVAGTVATAGLAAAAYSYLRPKDEVKEQDSAPTQPSRSWTKISGGVMAGAVVGGLVGREVKKRFLDKSPKSVASLGPAVSNSQVDLPLEELGASLASDNLHDPQTSLAEISIPELYAKINAKFLDNVEPDSLPKDSRGTESVEMKGDVMNLMAENDVSPKHDLTPNDVSPKPDPQDNLTEAELLAKKKSRNDPEPSSESGESQSVESPGQFEIDIRRNDRDGSQPAKV